MSSINYSWNRNLASNIIGSQVTGKCLRRSTLPQEFVEGVDRRLEFKEIPMLLAELERNSSPDRFNTKNCARYLKELSNLFKESLHMLFGDRELPYYAKERLRLGQVVNLFGGVEIVSQILFYPVVYGWSRRTSSTRTQQDLLHVYSLCLDFIHQLCLVVDGVASCLAKKNYLISHLFTLLEQKRTFAHASAVLEDLLGSRKEIIDLDSTVNIRKLMNFLDQQQLANLCRVLSFSLTDLESVEERSTLLAQDEVDKKGLSQKDLADNNQAILIGLKEFLPRLVKIACQPLVDRSLSSGYHGTHEQGGIMDFVDFQNFFQDVIISEGLDLIDSAENETAMPILQLSFKRMHEVMFKVEVFYVLCLFLTGKHKSVVQRRLSELKLIPGMCQMFDKISWLHESDSIRHEVMEIDTGDHECTPQTALRIQFLRLVHSFCDRHDNKHLLLTPGEVDELQQLYLQHGLALPESLSNLNRKLCCVGEKGLLTKILETLIKSPINAPLRFWLSRAIEGFLRGRASIGDQLFLIKRGLLEHLVDHITSDELKPKEILQSSFDLLGELMKFNPFAFKRFDQVISRRQFEKFVSILTSNVVDSNMLIRCLVLSQEHFKKTSFSTEFSTEACKLGTLISNWDQMIFLLYKLINSITVGTLTQENVSCLNTTLVFLMFAHRRSCLPSYLLMNPATPDSVQSKIEKLSKITNLESSTSSTTAKNFSSAFQRMAFVREENIQKNPGFIMTNLRLLLEFWKTHYLNRGKDCSALEQSSCISFDHWKQVVDILLSDSSHTTSVLHYLPSSCSRDS